PFCHLDAEDLGQKLRENLKPKQIPLVMSDGVFPVTGAIAPLREYIEILTPYKDGLLCVDDSHAVGVIGEKGQGSLEHCGVQGENCYLAGTLSKAFGGLGGIIPGSRELMEKISRNVRIPDGASPPSTAAASAMGLKILSEHPEMRTQLWSNVSYMRTGLRQLGIDVTDSPIPIVPVTGLSTVDLKQVQQGLKKEDILVAHIPPRGYSDAPDEESLRIAVFSTHTQEQIDRLLDALRKLV
ncbi:pyridoxal phosphate-dependent aminotransferase family protein, partial [Candidatus Bipolaricaulota bacterium]|nr:pyridoxal phosphate-dependent aminotransferase family protein [Candidatus Bipolaricaulota bacterium]